MPHEHRRILVVEDERSVLDLIVSSLDDFDVTQAESRDSALDIIRSTASPFQVIVTDQHLGDGYGNSVLSEALFLHPHTVRVIFSGADDAVSAAQAINESRVDRYIDKGAMNAISDLREACAWGINEYQRRVAVDRSSTSSLVSWYERIALERFSALRMYLPDSTHARLWEMWKPALPSAPPISALNLWRDANLEVAYQTFLREGFRALMETPSATEQYLPLISGARCSGNPVNGGDVIISPFALINVDRRAWRRSLVAFEVLSREIRGIRRKVGHHG